MAERQEDVQRGREKEQVRLEVGEDGVPAVIACPVACAPSLLPPIVIGAGPTAETREETVFEEGGDNADAALLGRRQKRPSSRVGQERAPPGRAR